MSFSTWPNQTLVNNILILNWSTQFSQREKRGAYKTKRMTVSIKMQSVVESAIIICVTVRYVSNRHVNVSNCHVNVGNHHVGGQLSFAIKVNEQSFLLVCIFHTDDLYKVKAVFIKLRFRFLSYLITIRLIHSCFIVVCRTVD